MPLFTNKYQGLFTNRPSDSELEQYANAETSAVLAFIPVDLTGTIKQLQEGLNNYEGISIAVDGIMGPKTEAAIQQAGFTIPLSEDEFNEIIAPPSDDDSSSGNSGAGAASGTDNTSNSGNGAQPASDETKDKTGTKDNNPAKPKTKPSLNWNPFGVNFHQNTTAEKAFVWGVWLAIAALLIWGMVVLFSENDKKK